MKMNPDVKAKWVAALRSGEYKQGVESLRSYRNEFCCLGVLCELHANEHGGKWEEKDDLPTYLGAATVLPRPVCVWAGLGQSYGDQVAIAGALLAVTEHNDDGRSFAEIAKAIEEQL
jgi:hypothetical protein